MNKLYLLDRQGESEKRDRGERQKKRDERSFAAMFKSNRNNHCEFRAHDFLRF